VVLKNGLHGVISQKMILIKIAVRMAGIPVEIQTQHLKFNITATRNMLGI
jgi:hypothetical protein